MKNIFYLFFIALFISSCSNKNDRGELVGVKGTKFFPDKPSGMVLIPSGSFLMGMADDDIAGLQNAPVSTVSVKAFYMDETEITNGEYRQFVNWVRDSVVRENLARQAISFFNNEPPTEEQLDEGIGKYYPNYTIPEQNEDDKSGYQLFKEEYGKGINLLQDSDKSEFSLNWNVDLIWDREEYPDLPYAEVIEGIESPDKRDKIVKEERNDSLNVKFNDINVGFYLPDEESYNGEIIFDVKRIIYSYTTFDAAEAIKNPDSPRSDYFKQHRLEVYPDTTAWIRDFSYSYNEPMHNDYFWHEAYTDYPVVGVSWEQANAFAHWRTMYKNNYEKQSKNGNRVANFRLPSEAEWEYAARGGLESATYPWGGPYTMDSEGCFLANFKPNRGDYAADDALYTIEAKSMPDGQNDYGLYHMAGNVSEWTASSYDKGAYEFDSGLNPNIKDSKNQRKVIKGGSWKDVAYFLRVSTRDYENQDKKRSYIGFRTVQDYLGEDGVDDRNQKKIF
ncbi:SUMF1/EgtB/PvdO family nonheme iron enzyme [Flavobacteriaceae bacterium]|nr:SUMF1/EgtB/PvdO family nonheme iron enzyme [Flavobacteriaceae bacterium]